MRPPCEIVVNKILPAIRSILMKELSKEHNLSQTEIAEKLDITQPAVSQYLKSVRGDRKVINQLKEENLYSEILKLSEDIAKGNAEGSQIIKEYCNICNHMMEEEILCEFHSESGKSISKEDCKVCLEAKKK